MCDFVPNPAQLKEFIEEKMRFVCVQGYAPFAQPWMLRKNKDFLTPYIDELNLKSKTLFKWVLSRKSGASRPCGKVELKDGDFCLLAVNYDLCQVITGFEPVYKDGFCEFYDSKPEPEREDVVEHEVDHEYKTAHNDEEVKPKDELEPEPEPEEESEDEPEDEPEDEDDSSEGINNSLVNTLQCHIEDYMCQLQGANCEIMRLNQMIQALQATVIELLTQK